MKLHPCLRGLLVHYTAMGSAALLHAQSAIQFTATFFNVTEGSPELAILVERTSNLDTVVSVDFATTTNGTATAGLDYVEVSANITFLANETNKLVAVPILNDAMVEPGETFRVLLVNATGGAILGARTTATVRIADNDKGLAFEFPSYSAREDEGSILIGVVRGDDGDFPVSVEFFASGITALAAQDYSATNGVLTFLAGEKVKLFSVPTLNDGLKELSETLRLHLTNATGVLLGTPATATVTIRDNDPGVQFTSNQLWVHEDEGAVVLTVTRGNDGLLDAFTVDYATTNLTAVAGQNYDDTQGTLEFSAGELTRTITLPVFDNGIAEPDKRFRVLLSNPSDGRTLGAGIATVTVCDTTGKRPHAFDSIHVGADGTVRLQVSGGVAKRFQPFFDIHVLEVSENLRDWTPLTWLVRTNTATNVLTYLDANAAGLGARFYRVQPEPAITPWPPPTGPHPVGRVDRLLTDPTRRNRYMISTNGSFMLSIWYPSMRLPGTGPTPFEDDVIARVPGWFDGRVDLGPHLRSYSVVNAPFAAGLSRCPVIFFSMGLNYYRKDAVDRFELLASHGFVVMAVDHYDTWYTVFPDGTAPIGTEGRDASEGGFQDRVRDFLFLLDEMTRWNEADPLLTGRLDVTNVGTMGFSWGGGVAAELCRVDPRCRAAAMFDSDFWFADAVISSGLPKPTLSMYRSDWAGDTRLFAKAKQDAVWFQISNTIHGSFSGSYWCSWWTGIPDIIQGREAARTMNDWTLWFFKRHLMGSSDPMPALADYPRILNFRQK